MSVIGEQVLLRVYLRSADRAPHTPTFQCIVTVARNKRLAGATVLRGIMGCGAHGLIKPSNWTLAEQAPVIIEIVDRAEKITEFVSVDLDHHLAGGMATLERASVMRYRHRAGDPSAALALGAALPPLSTLPQFQPRTRMTINANGILLRVFIGDSDRYEHKPFYEAIVQRVRELGLAGATVLRGTEGFGANSVVHKSNLLEMSTDLPVVIEIVDTEANINRLLPDLEKMVDEGMITMEYVMILLYRHGAGRDG